MRFTPRTWTPLMAMAGCLALMVGGWGGARTDDPQDQPALQSPDNQGAPAKRTALSFEDRGDIFMARKAYSDAVDYYYRALRETNFTNPVVWNKLGIAYQTILNYKASRKAYNKALRLRRDFPEVWNNLGTTYYLQHKYKKSLKYYEEAIKLKPSVASFHLNLGASYFGMKDFPKCVEETRAALNLDPNILGERSSVGTIMETRAFAGPQYYFYMAKVFASLGRPEEAIRYLRRAFEDGFKDRKKLDEDPDFIKISKNPAYIELINNPPISIKE